jgi:hypothetical protein
MSEKRNTLTFTSSQITPDANDVAFSERYLEELKSQYM